MIPKASDHLMPLQNMLLGIIDYFELKAFKKQEMQEGLSDIPLSI